MIHLYTRPLRVYVILGALALWGILSGFQLPISLFPNSQQTTVGVTVPFGFYSVAQFYEVHGRETEAALQRIKIDSHAVKELRAEYRDSNVQYQIEFEWGADPDQAMTEVRSVVGTRFANSDDEIRRGIRISNWGENQGFFAVSFYSPLRSMDELYETLNPLITPLQSQVEDAEEVSLYNPNRKEITVTLSPQRMALYEISSQQIEKAIQASVVSLNGGTQKIGERHYVVDIPRNTENMDDLGQVRVSPRGKPPIFLKDVSKISLGLSQNSQQKFKTSGVESLILFASPKEGGNVKNMSDQILSNLRILEKQWPSDIKYKVLVNPSEFINSSVKSVVKEVFLAAFLAVVILFLFIGSFKNVVTAAVEIPLSLLMAFILMRFTGMNLNLISLGGLALSAGMNVDASVVVLENIFRHFEGKKDSLTYAEKAQLVMKAVNEVKVPIIASTICSLVVFLPLIFTQGLTHSLLGDLAKAVIFSHGLSALVALVLVPTIRLHLLSKGQAMESHSPIEGLLLKLETAYRKSLKALLEKRKLQWAVFGSVLLLLPLLVGFVLPRLKKEVIGKPDTDWLMVGASSATFSNIKQIESELEMIEQGLTNQLGPEILYTFTQIYSPSNGVVMVRLKDKRKIGELSAKAEELYKNTATKSYWVDSWNPSELEIPDPPHYRVEISGGHPVKRFQAGQDLQTLFLEKNIFDKSFVKPGSRLEKQIRILQYSDSGSESEVFSKRELSHYLRVATDGVFAERIFEKQQELPIYLRLPKDSVTTLEQLKALPVGFEGKLIPLGALARMSFEDKPPRLYRENQRPLILVTGRLNKANLHLVSERQKQAHEALTDFKSKTLSTDGDMPSIAEVAPDKDLQISLDQLKWAIGISIFLVFLTMLLQLGDFVHSLLVLVAIPLGFIGVLISLFVFQSTLSLNSGLGTILLNGIAVANSIILVDFIRRLHQEGKDAKSATLEAAAARVRPILMTSLTTVLGMLPIALGLGEGGKILQPLGIAVCGGLWVSTLLTIYLVPTLQYLYLSMKENKT